MNKIVLQMGFLVFFLSLIYFGQRNLEWPDVLLRSFVMFVASTALFSVITILFMKAINKTSLKKNDDLANNISGK